MRRLPSLKKMTFMSSCWQNLTATLILGTITSVDIPVSGQQTTSTINLTNQANYSYTSSSNPGATFQGISSQLNAASQPLTINPLGKIVSCNGSTLTSYAGFSVGLYSPNPKDPTGTQLGNLVSLTPTQLPAVPNSNIPAGESPNTQNSNPYSLANSQPPGTYNFLLDSSKHQTDPGTIYILVVNPPSNTVYSQRRVKIQILNSTGVNNNVINYVATSLDGQPISTTGATQVQGNMILVPNAQLTSSQLFAFQLTTNLCQPSQIQITKTGDRATAEPGDTAIYRLSVTNLSDTSLNNISITDSLPLGFHFLPNSVQGAINNSTVTINTSVSGSTIIFTTSASLPTQQVLNIAYAVQLTNDAQRGTGINSAIVNGQRSDNQFSTKDGPATYKLKVQSGIVSDCGTILGRVFVDKNFDGEQQPGEAGVPNAVIFLEDGTRITTDPNGLFSLANVLPGYHTGVLDLTSLPGYTLAPNRKFHERNSQSRLVHVEPGGLVRMNFAVTPSFREQSQK